MVFITAGMGGGTGTGAAPIIAKCARERGILTVGVVTKPFTFEGRHRMRLADAGIAELQRYVDTLIVIPNQNLFRVANERTTFADAFGMADQVLHSGVRSITDLMILPGLINLDFADVRAVMSEMGKAMMGTGEALGRRPRPDGGPERHRQPAAGRDLAEGRQGRAGQHHRRPGHDPAGSRRGRQRHLRARSIRKPTSSSAPPSIRPWTARSASRSSPPAWTAPRSPPSSPRSNAARCRPNRCAPRSARAVAEARRSGDR